MKKIALYLSLVILVCLVAFWAWFKSGSDPYDEITDLKLTMAIEDALKHVGKYCHITKYTTGKNDHIIATSGYWWNENTYYTIALRFQRMPSGESILIDDPSVKTGKRSDEIKREIITIYRDLVGSSPVISYTYGPIRKLKGFDHSPR